MFIDKSAFLAILTNAPESEALLSRLSGTKRKHLTSPLVRVAVVTSLCNDRHMNRGGYSWSHDEILAAHKLFDRGLHVLNCQEVMITPRIGQLMTLFIGDFDLSHEDAVSAAIAVANGTDLLSLDKRLLDLPLKRPVTEF